MACNNGGKITKKKIVVLSSVASGIVATYVAFTLTHNLAIAATIPALLSLAACPAMCVGMGGAFWLVRRLTGKNRNKDQILESKEEEHEESSCCSSDEERQEMRTTSTSTIPKRKNEDDIEAHSYYLQKHKIEFEN